MLAKISVAMATYNGDKYISQQLDSILNQSLMPYEIIISDDASTDDTVAIINEYMAKYKIIKIYQKLTNIGVVKNFENAIKLCTGDYIALSDQDDVWLPNKLQMLLDNIDDNYLIHSDAILVDEKLHIIADSHFALNKDKYSKTVFDYLRKNNVTGCCAMITRQLVDLALPIPDGFYIHDHYFAIIAASFGKIKYLDRCLIYYRQHSGNVIGITSTSYTELTNGFNKITESYKLLYNNALLSNSNIDIQWFIEYYHNIAICKSPSISLLKWIFKNLGAKELLMFVSMTCFRKSFAAMIYTLRNKLRNLYRKYRRMPNKATIPSSK